MEFLKKNFKDLSDPNRNYYLTVIGWNTETQIILDKINLRECNFETDILPPLLATKLEGGTDPSQATDKLMEFWKNVKGNQPGKNELHAAMITDGEPNNGRWGQDLKIYARKDLRNFLHQENVSLSGLILDNAESSFLQLIDMFDSSPAHLSASFNVVDLIASTKPAELEAAAYFSLAKNLLGPYSPPSTKEKIDFTVSCGPGVRVTSHFFTQTSGQTDDNKLLKAQTWVEESAENIRIEIPLSMARRENTPLCADIKISAGGREIELKFDDEKKLTKQTEVRISENYSCKDEDLMAILKDSIHIALWSNSKDRITALQSALDALGKMDNPPKGFKGTDDKSQTIEIGLKLCLKYANQTHSSVQAEITNYLSSLIFVIERGALCPCFFNLANLEARGVIDSFLLRTTSINSALKVPQKIPNGYVANYTTENDAIYVSQLSKDMEKVEKTPSVVNPASHRGTLFGGEPKTDTDKNPPPPPPEPQS